MTQSDNVRVDNIGKVPNVMKSQTDSIDKQKRVSAKGRPNGTKS